MYCISTYLPTKTESFLRRPQKKKIPLTTHIHDIHDSGGQVDGALPVSRAVGVAQGPVAESGRGERWKARERDNSRGGGARKRRYLDFIHVYKKSSVVYILGVVAACVFDESRFVHRAYSTDKLVIQQ